MLRAEILAPAEKTVDRTRDVVFYSGAKIQRMDFWSGARWWLKFSMEPDDMDLDRLNAGAPVLNSHSAFSLDDQIGVVERGWVEDGKAKATLRFSERDEVEPIWQDIQAGIIRNVSMGVKIDQLKEVTPKGAKEKEFLALGWTPGEISVVSMNADPGAQFLSAQRDGAGELMYRIVPVTARLDYLHAETPETNSAPVADGEGQAGPDLGPMIATARLREAIAINQIDSGR